VLRRDVTLTEMLLALDGISRGLPIVYDRMLLQLLTDLADGCRRICSGLSVLTVLVLTAFGHS
jgi:hypothetical protein